jgi:LuxR family maltose regulon positive regulatory protein
LTPGDGVDVPRPHRPMLVRARLLDRLRERWSVPVTVVGAPAGYGKTVLLIQAIEANSTTPSRTDHSVECRGNMTASVLGEALCRAVGAPPPMATGVDGIVSSIGQAMRQRSPQHVCLVLDDVHDIAAAIDGAEILAALIASLPANGHVVLAGRLAPAPFLEGLGSSRDRNILHLDQTELAFTEGEMAAFAALRGVPVTKVSGSGGWPALAELSIDEPFVVLREYVEQEVLSPLTPAERRHVALLAHLGWFDDDVARAVLGPDADVSRLVATIPLVEADHTGVVGRWRLHRLWRRVLGPEAPPNELADARRRAAARLGERGQVTAAVPLLLDAGAYDELGQAIVQVLVNPRPMVPREVLTEWLAAIPDDLRASPSGELLAGVIAAETDPEGAWRHLEACVAAFRALGDARGELASIVHLGELAWWNGRSEPLAAVARRILELAAEGCEEAIPLTPASRVLLGGSPEIARRAPGEPDQPSSLLDDGYRAQVRALESITLLQSGEPEEALEHADRALADAGPTYAPLIEATRFHALRCLGRVAEMLDALPDVLRRIERTGHRHVAALAAAHGGLVYALQGESEHARLYLAQARSYVSSTQAPIVHTAVAIVQAALAVDAGDEEKARAGLATELARHPLDQGLPAGPYRWNIALIYVLMPETRSEWDRTHLGPALAVARDLARAVVAVREDGHLPAEAPVLTDAAVVQAHLPRRWVAELATTAVVADRDDGRRLLEVAWPAVGAIVASLADEGPAPLSKNARAVMRSLRLPPAERLELLLLGPLELRRGGVPVHAPDWRRERVRSLLAYLALRGKVSRHQLVHDLWPGFDAESQDRNFRVTLTYLLRVLEPLRPPRGVSYFIRQDSTSVTLHAGEWLTVDVWDFDAACRRADEAHQRGCTAETLAHALTAVELWRGDATDLASASWAVGLLEERHIRFVAITMRAAELLFAQGNADHARLLAERVLAVDPWVESAHRTVVASYWMDGDHLAVRRAVGRYQATLHELGMPMEEAARMAGRLLDSLRS